MYVYTCIYIYIYTHTRIMCVCYTTLVYNVMYYYSNYIHGKQEI